MFVFYMNKKQYIGWGLMLLCGRAFSGSSDRSLMGNPLSEMLLCSRVSAMCDGLLDRSLIVDSLS